MAELHPNQIPFEAPEPVMANFAYEKDYLSGPILRLGELSMKVAETQAAYDDNNLKTKLADIALKAQHAIDEEKSLDANYDEIAAKYIALYNSTVDTAGAAGTRFLRTSPYAKDEFAIEMQTQALKKHQTQVYNRSKLDVAQWSSQIVNAPEEYQDALLKDKRRDIQNLGLTLEQTDDLLFKLQSEVDNYQIAYYISNGYYDKAKEKLRSGLPTIGAATRAYLWKQLQGEIEAESARKAQEQKAIEAAKENGTDATAMKILEAHRKLLEADDLEGAERLRRDFYYGKDLSDGTSSAGFSSTAKQKLFNTMETQAKQSPAYNQYRAEYMSDLNRLSSGLMAEDGSLILEKNESITPEQYNLARKLRDSQFGWDILPEKQQIFINNVLRGYSNNLSLLDLNPNAELKGTTLGGIDYVKVNPAINYQALNKLYSNPANIILANLNQDGTSLTGREVETIDYIAKEYENKVFTGDYELSRGTRPKALLGMFAQLATKNNPTGMAEVGLENISRETLEKNFLNYIGQMKNGGFYEADATYPDLITDFKNLYKMTTGYDFVDTADKSRGYNVSKYAELALQYANKDDYSYNDYNREGLKTFVGNLPKDVSTTFVTDTGDLYPVNKNYRLERSRQVAGQLKKSDVLVDYIEEPNTRFLINKINEERSKKDPGLFFDYAGDVLPATGMVWNGLTPKERLELERVYNYLDDEQKTRVRRMDIKERIRVLKEVSKGIDKATEQK